MQRIRFKKEKISSYVEKLIKKTETNKIVFSNMIKEVLEDKFKDIRECSLDEILALKDVLLKRKREFEIRKKYNEHFLKFLSGMYKMII